MEVPKCDRCVPPAKDAVRQVACGRLGCLHWQCEDHAAGTEQEAIEGVEE